MKREYVALNAFKDLYKHSLVVQMAFEFDVADGEYCVALVLREIEEMEKSIPEWKRNAVVL